MSNHLLALGLSHKTAPLALRERVAFGEREALELASALRAREGAAAEAVVLTTCNRTELYLVSGEAQGAQENALSLLAHWGKVEWGELQAATYALSNCEAARHLFRVTAGLESMVLGEAEIQGQVRRAYEQAVAGGHTGPLTNRLFSAALATGKLVRSRTGLGRNQTSIPSLAVTLGAKLLGSLTGRVVVVIGTGESAELTAMALAREGAQTVFVANRRIDRARALAERFGGGVVMFERLPAKLLEADIVVASTSSPHSLLGAKELAEVMAARHGRPLLLIDLAVPRDIEPACRGLAGVTLYDIDDLEEVIAENLLARAQEVPKAELIIERELRRFARYLGEADALPTIRELRRLAEDLAKGVVEENAGRWESASEADLKRVELIAQTVANRLLHHPTLRLRELAGARRHGMVELVRELFGLDAPKGPRRNAEPEQQEKKAVVRRLPLRR